MNITFTPKARERFRDLTWNHPSLNEKIIGLLRWDGDNTITVSADFGPKDFFFTETDRDGRRVMCGGIIFHRNYKRDERGEIVRDDNGIAVYSHEDDGEYSIHT